VRCQNCSIPVDTLPVCREYQDRQVLIFPMLRYGSPCRGFVFLRSAIRSSALVEGARMLARFSCRCNTPHRPDLRTVNILPAIIMNDS
jgi:hypothetical protein